MFEERDSRIKELLERGVPKVHIANELGIARDTVDRVAARAGFPAKRRSQDNLDWQAIREYYDAGHSAAQTMRRFGFSAATWDAAIARAEISPRTRPPQLPAGTRRRQVEVLLDEGLGIAEIANRLKISKPTVCYHCRKLGIPPRTQFARRYDWEAISQVYDSGVSQRECRKRFGFSNQAWHDAVARGDVTPRDHRIPLEELLVVGRPTGRGHLKRRLITEGLKENRCERCGIDEWQGEPLDPQLHHRNGNGLDNRLPNLAFLCPNCHALTDTWGGRNKPKQDAA